MPSSDLVIYSFRKAARSISEAYHVRLSAVNGARVTLNRIVVSWMNSWTTERSRYSGRHPPYESYTRIRSNHRSDKSARNDPGGKARRGASCHFPLRRVSGHERQNDGHERRRVVDPNRDCCFEPGQQEVYRRRRRPAQWTGLRVFPQTVSR